MTRHPSISIIVNTWNRGQVLGNTLESFRWLKYPGDFEVIVVNGPSTDNTDAILALWDGKIRVGRCPVPNLSMSRNIGIAMAQGELIAFIDDDAIPEPEWLAQLARAFVHEDVAGAGGLIFDHTGYSLQYAYNHVNRLGDADWTMRHSMPQFIYPKSFKLPYLGGGNAAYRKKILVEIGGFDEEYSYYLEDSDVCLRILDHGHIIKQLPDAYIHHKSAPSNIRGINKFAKKRYEIVKNKIYFALKNAGDYCTLEEIYRNLFCFVDDHRSAMHWALSNRQIENEDLIAFEKDVQNAFSVGSCRGLEGARPSDMLTPEKLEIWKDDFLQFQPIPQASPRVVVLIAQYFPPEHVGGIPTFMKDLAEGLAAEGHLVHVITRSPDINRVDLEDGVWVHRMEVYDVPLSDEARSLNIPLRIWNWSATAMAEVVRISAHRKIDVVETPIWDCEGVAFLLNKQWPIVVSLQTTLHFWLLSHSECANDLVWMSEFGTPMLALEKIMMCQADAVRSISQSIRREIEVAYGFIFDDSRIVISPLGMKEAPAMLQKVSEEELTVLFVGRLEGRKGIDVLFKAIPFVLAEVPEARFRLLGDDTLPGLDGKSTYKDDFLASKIGQSCSSSIVFEGRVDDSTLCAAYADCDIFVAPSRFESFGLVFLEAMRVGKPVIGCHAGGMPEVVAHEECGILVPPADPHALAQALVRLLNSKSTRERMGACGREIFRCKFTSKQMALGSYLIYDLARKNYVPPLVKVSYVNGICVNNDAISSAARDGVIALSNVENYEVRLYTYKCDFIDLPFDLVADERRVLESPFFQNSDLVVFHFGIYYPLFDLLKRPAGNTKRLVVFHNVTPKAFVAAESHELIDRSIEQIDNIAFADHVICDSEVNLAVLRNAGIQTPATVLPLAVHVSQTPPLAKPSFNDGTVRILFIGRFVSSKGPLDLLQAIQNVLVLNADLNLQVNMIGNLEFSDPKVVSNVKVSMQHLEIDHPRRLQIFLHGSATDEVKSTMLRDSDIFVLPTYHEGFCVPIIEAFANGCRVVAYENSNVPSISGGFATLVPTGDIGLLSEAMSMIWKQVLSSQWKAEDYKTYSENLSFYVQRFSPEQVANRFSAVVAQVLSGYADLYNLKDDSSWALSGNESGVVAKPVNVSRTGIGEGSRCIPSERLNGEAQAILDELKSEIKKARSNANCH